MKVGHDTYLLVFAHEFAKAVNELINEFANMACMRRNDEIGSSLFEMCGEDAVFQVMSNVFPAVLENYREETEIITLEEAERRKLAMN